MKNFFFHNDLPWLVFVALAILALSSIPFWVGRAVQTNELLFRGIYFDETDYAVHLSMMQAGRMGDWAYQLRFTDEEHPAAYLRLFYIALGHVSKWISLDVEPTYHLARWVLGFFALYCIYQLFRKIFSSVNHARAAFLLAALGGGVGLIQLLLGVPLEPISPIDFWLIDVYVFFSISLFPSFSFSLALMALALTLFLDYLDTGKWQLIFWVALISVLSQSTNPISFAVVDLAFAGAVFAMWWKNKAVNFRQLAALGVIAIVQMPMLLYNFLVLTRDPIWSQFTLQNETLSPPPSFYFWGFLPFLILAWYGIILSIRESSPALIGLTVWVVLGFGLAYMPVPIQRRFLLGITIPLAGLAIHGLSHLVKYIPALVKREGLIYFSYILLASISSIYLSLGSILFLQTLPADKYYSRDIEDAIIWLNNNAKPNDFVLADIPTSQLIAQRSMLKVYVGHEMETLDYSEKKQEMELFFSGELPNDWLLQTKTKWVIANKDEARQLTRLEIMHENNGLIIYKVKE